MLDSEIIKSAEKLINYIKFTKQDFEPVTQRTPYFHMGATIVDAILQAGLNYNNVVYLKRPKVTFV